MPIKIKSKTGIFRFFRGQNIITLDNSKPIFVGKDMTEKEYESYSKYFILKK